MRYNIVLDEKTFSERMADDIAEFAGSWRFIISFGFILMGWIIFNSLAILKPYHFDPYPYILLNLVLSFIAAFQAPFIMMSQNRAERKQDIAYREIFRELKELIDEDTTLEHQIKEDVKLLIATQNRLMSELQKIGKITIEGVAEVLEHLEEEENKDHPS
jgi:uncharacterized membrane protein